MINDNSPPIPELIQGMTSGERLSSRRDELGWELQEVAHSLNLSIDTLKALEEDNYTSLPGTTFVRGYLRSYSRLLGIDEEEVLQDLGLEQDKIKKMPGLQRPTKVTVRTAKTKKKSGGFLKTLFILILLAGLVWSIVLVWQAGAMNKLMEWMELPQTTEQSNQDENVITFSSDEPSAEESDDAQKGALIRIE